MAPNHALVLRAGDELARAARWAELPEDELRRRATHAANERDAGQLVELTLAYLRINRSRLADSTAASYAHAIRLLIAGWSGVNLLRAGANAGALWVRRLEGVDPPLSPSTIAGRLAGVRALYRALRWSGATTADPFADARPPSDPRARWDRRHPYSEHDLEQLLHHATGSDRLLVLLGGHAGLRVSEILALRVADIDLDRRILTVLRGKGGKRRTVPLSATLTSALVSQSDPIFHYTTRAQAAVRMRALCQRAGVFYRGIHSLRHAAGTWTVAHGGTLEDARDLLGHSSVSTTEIYSHHASDRMERLMGER